MISSFGVIGPLTIGSLASLASLARSRLNVPFWAAAIHGKKREFSSALREGISETLVLLAVHGKHLFGKRLGFDGELAAARLVGELLEPFETRKLKANDRYLPLYAEAAPKEFF